MQEQPADLIARVNAAVLSDTLKPKAKALLLLRLCQIYSVLSPHKGNEYWKQLTSLHNHVPQDLRSQLDDLRLLFDQAPAPSGGFAGERIAEINTTLSKPGVSESEIRTCLKACEELVRKRFWPFGKEAVREALVKAWTDIDRAYALELSAKLYLPVRKTLVRRMNQLKPLSPQEWDVLVKATSQKQVIELVLKILNDPQPRLNLPGSLIPSVFAAIRAKLDQMDEVDKENCRKEVLDNTDKLVGLVATEDRLPQVFESLKSSVRELAKTAALQQLWPNRFSAVEHIITLGVSSGVVSDSNAGDFTEFLPRHMIDFGRAHCSALLANDDTARQMLSELLKVAQQKAEAEAWFLITLVHRGLGELSYALARESSRSSELLPRIRRAWLCNYTGSASAAISVSEVQGDPAAEILLHAPGPERIAYLRERTEAGKKSLPDAVWASEKPAEEKKGFWASLMSSGKTVDQMLEEYLKRNPLYHSYRVVTPEAQQFAEYLRISGYGEYSYEFIDQVLLNEFVLWADDKPEEVTSLLKRMWQAIQPEEDILKLDFLRNAIFTRCTTVFAAVPDTLVSDFLPWLKTTLIDKSLKWQIGKTQFTLHYPESALSSMCIRGAAAVHTISSARCDQLVEIALTRYPSEAGTAELAAQLYNTGKELLDLTLPWKTKTDVVESWQVGIVKNAINPTIQAIIENETGSS